MSWRNLQLPNYDTVVSWDSDQLQQWLLKNDLADFNDFVKESPLNGKSLLDLYENDTSILFNKNFVDISPAKKQQLAKCVKECKNQASQAKKQISKCISECKVQANQCKKVVNNTLKSKREKRSFNVQDGNSKDENEESDYSGNEWDTDFEGSDEEDEKMTPVFEESSSVKDINLTEENRLQSTPRQNGTTKIGYYDMQNQNQDQNSNEIALPQSSPSVVLKHIKRYDDVVKRDIPKSLPPKPQVSPKPNSSVAIPKPPNTNFQELIKKTTVITTLTRPKTQPPAPPVVQPVLPSDVIPAPPIPPILPYEDAEYETPIHSHPPSISNGLVRAYPAFAYTSSNSSTSDSQDAYEIISNPDDSGNVSMEFVNNEIQGRNHAQALANEIRLNRNISKMPSYPPPVPTIVAGPTIIDSSLTPPLPQKSKPLKSSSSISIFQSKIGLKIIKNGNSGNTQSSKPLPPKPGGTVIEITGNPDGGFSTLSSNDRLNRPLPGLPKETLTSLGDDLGLLNQPYYREIEREEAEQLVLTLGQDGAFLVRPSRKGGMNNPFSLTLVQSGMPFHLNIRSSKGKYALGKEKENEKVFDTIPSMIKYHRNTPIFVTSKTCMGKECYLKIYP